MSADSPVASDNLSDVPTPDSGAYTLPAMSGADASLQAALSKMLQSPTQMRKVLAAVASQSSTPHDNNNGYDETHLPLSKSLLTDVQRYASTPFKMEYNPTTLTSPAPAMPPTPHIHNSQTENMFTPPEQRLQRTYSDTQEIAADVDKLDHSINSLIESLGLDPNYDYSQPTNTAGTQWSNHVEQPVDDFDLDAFLTDMSTHATIYDNNSTTDLYEPNSIADASTTSRPQMKEPIQAQYSTFLDDVTDHEAASATSGGGELFAMPLVDDITPLGADGANQRQKRSPRHLKRKSGTMDLNEDEAPTPLEKPASKTKRKR